MPILRHSNRTKAGPALVLFAGLLSACTAASPQTPPPEPPGQPARPVGEVVVEDTRHAVERFFNTAAWQQLPPRLENQVEPIRLEHAVAFDATRAELSAREHAELRRFLVTIGAGAGDRIEVDGPRPGGGRHDPLTSARLAQVRHALERFGLRPDVAEQPLLPPNAPVNAVRVVVTRVMVIPPECEQPQPQPWKRPLYDFGCTTTANLGRMVADPVDLERGKPLDPADGEQAVLGIQRYQTDQVKPLEQVNTGTQ